MSRREETEGEREAWESVMRTRSIYELDETEEALQALDFALAEWNYQRGETAWQRVQAESARRKASDDA